MKKWIFLLLGATVFLTGVSYGTQPAVEPAVYTEKLTPAKAIPKNDYILLPTTAQVLPESHTLDPLPSPEVEPAAESGETSVSEEDIKLLALMTMTEAEGEPEEGQRLVIDSILNRVDDPHFPDTIYDVIWQPNQYSGMQPPRINHCWVKEEPVQLVREELEHRTNYDVIFFRTWYYHSYGVPMFQVGAHYFSSYD